MEDQTPNFADDDARQAPIPPAAGPSVPDEGWSTAAAPRVDEQTPAPVPSPEWHEVEPTQPSPVPPLDEPVAAEVPEPDWTAESLPTEESPAASALAIEPSAQVPEWHEVEPSPAPPVVAEVPAPAEKKPLWKRELTFGRKKDAAEPEKVEELPVQPAAAEVPAPVQKKPVWKRELALGRKREKTAAEPKAAEPKKQTSPKKPRLKRELGLGGLTFGAKKASSAKSGKAGAGARGGSVKKIVGLTIGSSQMAAAEVQNNGHAEILKLAQRPLQRGTVVGGELRDVDGLAR